MTIPFKFEGTEDTRNRIAPEGVLRVGLYQGSPSSYMLDPASNEARGVGYLLGKCFAGFLGVSFKPCISENNSDVLAAVKSGTVDLVFTNATKQRAEYIDFATVLLTVGKSVLVPPQSPLHELQSLSTARFRIGYSKGSTTGTEFSTIFPKTELIPVETLESAATLLAEGALDGFATNRAILSKVETTVPGSRIVPGSWGREQYALGMPYRHEDGRQDGRQVLSSFSAWVNQSGTLETFIRESGFAGAEPTQPPTGKP